MLPSTLAGGLFFFIAMCIIMTYNLYIGLYLTQRQGTFLHQARSAMAQERRQKGKLYGIQKKVNYSKFIDMILLR
jgi:hypothetical protein